MKPNRTEYLEESLKESLRSWWEDQVTAMQGMAQKTRLRAKRRRPYTPLKCLQETRKPNGRQAERDGQGDDDSQEVR